VTPTARLVRVAVAAAVTAAGAAVRIPLPHVPLTLQLAGVCAAGAWLGPRAGACSQALYLAAGLAGLPVFACGGGPQYVLQPTFGFLAGFPAAAAAVGLLCRTPACSLGRAVLAALAAVAVVDACGILGLHLHARFVLEQPVPPRALLLAALVPLPKDLLIAVPAVLAAHRARQWQRAARPASERREPTGCRDGHGDRQSPGGPAVA